MTEEPKHELISYNKKFKPGTAGVKLTFSPEELAFGREDMPMRAAIARRDVLLSLQPQIDGLSKQSWNNDVMVVIPKEPFNPRAMYVTDRHEHDPPFRRDFYDHDLPWDGASTIDQKLQTRQFSTFRSAAQEGTLRASAPLFRQPLLVTRQLQYAQQIKEHGIPAAQPPPPFIVQKPRMARRSQRLVRRFDMVNRGHDGAWGPSEALGGNAWSCCGATEEDAPGCRRQCSNELRSLYD
jgi:hypothetical protein